jgi:glycosyltransferase involved in cell wall biosynthesis
MKILITAPNLITGGAEKQLIYLINGLVELNYEIVLLLLEREGEYLENLPEIVEIISPQTPRPSNFMKEFWKFREIKRTIDLIEPDILYSRLWPTKTATVLAGLLTRKPVVFSEDRSLSRYMSDKSLSQRLKLLTRKLSSRLSSMIIPVSRGIENELLTEFGINPRKMKLIYNGFNFEEMRIKAAEKVRHEFFQNNDERNKVIVALGRMVKLKGFDYLLEAVKIVNDRGLNVRLIMIGKGDYLDNLKLLAVDLGLTDIIDFVGFVENPFAYMANSDLFVLSSLFEGLPSTLIEAMGLGLPVISSRCPTGPEEIIEDNKNGLLVPVADSAALADSITSVLTDNDLKEKLKIEGKKRAEDFSLDKMYKSFSDMFEMIYSH